MKIVNISKSEKCKSVNISKSEKCEKCEYF